LDAVLLARALSAGFRFKDSDALSKSLAAFEETMLERSAVKVRASADAAKFLHSDLAVAKGNITRGAAAKAEYNL
jgi:salicylate hydroxylase